MNNGFKKFLDNFEGYCCVVFLMAMSAIIILQVFFRFVVKGSLPWSEEASRYLLVWTAFIGGAYGVRRGAHIGIEAFALLLPKKAQKVLTLFINIVSLFICVLVCKYGFEIVSTQLASGQLSPAMRIPMGYVYSAIPIGMIFFIIRYIQEIISEIKSFKNHGKEAAE